MITVNTVDGKIVVCTASKEKSACVVTHGAVFIKAE